MIDFDSIDLLPSVKAGSSTEGPDTSDLESRMRAALGVKEMTYDDEPEPEPEPEPVEPEPVEPEPEPEPEPLPVVESEPIPEGDTETDEPVHEAHSAEPTPEDQGLVVADQERPPAVVEDRGPEGEEVGEGDGEETRVLAEPITVGEGVTLFLGDSLDVMATMPENSVDAIVTDPPYGLSDNKLPDMAEILQHWIAGDDYQHRGGGFMGKCFHPDTDVLTSTGWKPIGLVQEGDMVCSLTPSGEVEFVPAVAVHEYDFDGDLLRVGGRSAMQTVTPNHNIWTDRGLRRADSLPSKFRLYNQGRWRGQDVETLHVEGSEFPSRPLMSFLGLWLGDGYVAHRQNQPWKQDYIGFSVFKDREVQAIRSACESLGVKYTVNETGRKTVFYVYDKALLAWLSPQGGAHSKFIPTWVFDLDASILEYLYQGLMDTDGSVQGPMGQHCYDTVSDSLADDFQRLCLQTGRSATKTWRDRLTNFGKSEGWRLSVLQARGGFWMERDGRRSRPQPAAVQPVPYRGRVHCVTLERNHILMSRYEGKTVWSGNSWDSFVPGPALWKEALRVLKPGGHILCFAGSRTVDLMGLSLRLAGFEIRDQIQWLYGCLTDDAEVLTETGWKPGVEVSEGERVAQWDNGTGEISLAPVEQVFRAPWDGPMRVLRNADTDQLLTPNHRVYHRTQKRKMIDGVRKSWFDSEWEVSEAADLDSYNPVKLPIAGVVRGVGIGGVDYAALLGWVWTEGGFDLSGTGVRIYQSSVNREQGDEIAALMDRMGPHKRYDRTRAYRGREYVESCWYFSGDLANRVRDDLPGKRPTYPLLWRMTQDEREAFLDAAMKGDGSGWGAKSQQFHQKYEDDLVWLQTLLHLSGRSGKVAMRSNREGGVVYLRNTDTTELQARHQKGREYEHYQGEVWCVKVPSGAFVARRNGKVFITGNSGFPKSMDVSKAIDKAAGKEREVIGKATGGGFKSKTIGTIGHGEGAPDITAPATPEAAQWEGWGTALKPAHEPIVVARKPFKGTVAKNVLEHGTGALNIDGTRISTNETITNHSRSADAAISKGKYGDSKEQETHQTPGQELGRWPANVILGHHDDCEELGTTTVNSDGHHPKQRGNSSVSGTQFGGYKGQTDLNERHARGEAVVVWDCHPDCPVRILDSQSGVSKSSGGKGKSSALIDNDSIYGKFSGENKGTNAGGLGDKGGASRFFYQAKASKKEREAGLDDFQPASLGAKGNGLARTCNTCGASVIGGCECPDRTYSNPKRKNNHPTVKPIALMRYLIRLVTPPGGRVLDPFTGSGTTGIAAVLEGFNFVGIELDPEYVTLAQARIKHWTPDA